MLDLTLDLFRIQSGMQTMQFAYTTDEFGSYDIISTKECEEMDMKLNLMDPGGYLDKTIIEVKNKISNIDLSIEDNSIYVE